jgi:magnesium transporter
MFDGLIRRAKPGTAPGLLVGREPVAEEALTFTLTEYTTEGWEVYNEVEIAECSFHLTTPGRTWIDVAGHASAEMLRSLGQAFHLHALALEDVFHGNQRPKLEIYDKQGFVVLNDPAIVDDTLKSRQVSIFFGDNYVISFHEHKEDIFKPVRERIQQDGSRLRQFGTDYLLYALVDLVVDRKFPLLSHISERLEELEEQSMEKANRETAQCIHSTRRALVGFHRIQWAERETVLALMRPDTPFIKPDTRTYLRDCLDHTVTVQELVESYRDMAGGLMELHLMETSNRMNEVMKTLAIVTVFFMPLSFLAGVYGMNFETSLGNMPELGWKHGYVFFWVMVVLIVGSLFTWMRHRKWL